MYLRCKQLLPWLRGLQQLTQTLAALQHGRGHSYLELAGYELAFGTSDRPCLFEEDVVLTQTRRARRQRCGYVREWKEFLLPQAYNCSLHSTTSSGMGGGAGAILCAALGFGFGGLEERGICAPVRLER